MEAALHMYQLHGPRSSSGLGDEHTICPFSGNRIRIV